jgi:hypothetical protein
MLRRLEVLEANATASAAAINKKFSSLTTAARVAIALGVINLIVKLLLPFGLYPHP